jgi:hypothetical protein
MNDIFFRAMGRLHSFANFGCVSACTLCKRVVLCVGCWFEMLSETPIALGQKQGEKNHSSLQCLFIKGFFVFVFLMSSNIFHCPFQY